MTISKQLCNNKLDRSFYTQLSELIKSVKNKINKGPKIRHPSSLTIKLVNAALPYSILFNIFYSY